MYDGIYPVASDAMGEGKMDPWIAEGAVRILLKSKCHVNTEFSHQVVDRLHNTIGDWGPVYSSTFGDMIQCFIVRVTKVTGPTCIIKNRISFL